MIVFIQMVTGGLTSDATREQIEIVRNQCGPTKKLGTTSNSLLSNTTMKIRLLVKGTNSLGRHLDPI